MANFLHFCVVLALTVSLVNGLPLIFLRRNNVLQRFQDMPNQYSKQGSTLDFMNKDDVIWRDLSASGDSIEKMNMDDLAELLLRLASGNKFMININGQAKSDSAEMLRDAQLRVQRRTPLSDSQSMKLSNLLTGSNTGLLSRPGK